MNKNKINHNKGSNFPYDSVLWNYTVLSTLALAIVVIFHTINEKISSPKTSNKIYKKLFSELGLLKSDKFINIDPI